MVQAARGTLIAYATSPGSVAADGEGQNGLYTHHLLRQMEVPDQSVEQMFKQVRTGVVAATRGKQTPWESSSLTGHFTFKGIAPPCTPPPGSPTGAPSAHGGSGPGHRNLHRAVA